MIENNETGQENAVVKQTVVERSSGENVNPENQGVSRSTGSSVYEKTTVGSTGQGNLKARRIVYYILGLFEILLACRFVLRLLGANPGNAFVQIIYSITNVLLWPFSGIFRSAVNTGIETKSVMEPATIIAVIVYAIVGWGIVKLIQILKKSDMPKA